MCVQVHKHRHTSIPTRAPGVPGAHDPGHCHPQRHLGLFLLPILYWLQVLLVCSVELNHLLQLLCPLPVAPLPQLQT